MTCPELEELERCVSGELSTTDRSRVEQHLESCDDCRGVAEEVAENLRAAVNVRSVLRDNASAISSLRLPEEIGRYRIVAELGRGGMGVVYEAEQDKPHRRVALKVIRPGCATPSSLRRFEHESQMLGRLQHPGIAQIFEADTADTGNGPQPYFAMEFIHGLPLGTYCHKHDCGTRQQLELMSKVCDAIQHAHVEGVVHRDLKPSNILVDKAGQPKVLDFGVARAADSDLQLTTMQTDVAQLIGTIPYMSPEQASGDPDELDTRSDIYALGVIIYELLAGRLPYDLNRRVIPEAVRVIREEDPTPLSSINQVFRGDVETIVAKALEKDKNRRYQSAAELASDIRRHLRDEPITARRASTLYQFRKFARRNRVLVGATVSVFLALLGGATVSTWQAVRATNAERLAQDRLRQAQQAQIAEAEQRERAQDNEQQARRELRKFEAVNEILQEMLTSIDPSEPGSNPEVTVREVLDRTAARLDNESLIDQPEVEASVRTTVGNTYRALGLFEEAEPHLRSAVRIRRTLYPDGHPDLAHSLNKLARLVQERGNYDDAEPLFREALAMHRALHGDEHEDVAKLMSNLGWLLNVKDQYEQAEQLQRQALAMRRELLGNNHSSVATSLNNLAVLLYSTLRHAEAEPLLRESLAIDRELRGEHPNVATTMTSLGLVLGQLGRHDEAESLLRRALEMRERLVGTEHPDYATGLSNLAALLRDTNQLEEAELLFRQALVSLRRLLGDRHPQVGTTLSNLAGLLVDQGEDDAAVPLYRETLDIWRAAYGATHTRTLSAMHKLSGLYVQRGEYAAAETLIAEALTAARRTWPEGHWYIGDMLGRRGHCLMKLEQFDESKERLSEAFILLRDSVGIDHPRTKKVVEFLVEFHEVRRQPDKARHWRALLAPEQAQPSGE